MNAKIDLSSVTLETERLLLRPFRNGDLDDLFHYASVEGVGEMAGWKHHETKEESKCILEMFQNERKVFALVDKESNQVIGSLGLEEYREDVVPKKYEGLRCREIGYVLSKEYWGNGLVPEAVQAVISYCFLDLDLDALFCSHFVENSQSKRVIEKCGFEFLTECTLQSQTNEIKQAKYYVLENNKKKVNMV